MSETVREFPIPRCKLRLESYMTNPPRPKGVCVFVDDKIVAMTTLQELAECYRRMQKLSVAHDLAMRGGRMASSAPRTKLRLPKHRGSR